MWSSRLFIIGSWVVFGNLVVLPSTFAYEAIVETIPVPYEVVQLVGDTQTSKVVLGELQDAPEMFELVIDATSTLALEVRAIPTGNTQPIFSGIIIKQKAIRGIEEVARMSATDATWDRLVDSSTGLPYLAGPYFSETVTPGTYRIEVSNANNQGKYLLVLGSGDDDQSYVESLRAVMITYEFYGTSKLKLFNSPYVHYPVGILLGLLVMSVTVYKNRHRFVTPTPINHA